jgi:hypothetical protein
MQSIDAASFGPFATLTAILLCRSGEGLRLGGTPRRGPAFLAQTAPIPVAPQPLATRSTPQPANGDDRNAIAREQTELRWAGGRFDVK